MKVTFVVLGSEQIAVSQLSAILKRDGHKVGLAFSASLFNDRYNLEFPLIARFFDDKKEVLDAIRKQKPDILAFSCLTSTYQWMLEIAREAKKIFPGVKTIFGGVHVSAVPDRVIVRPEVDYVVVGEGEVALPQIVKAIENGGSSEPIPNTRYKADDGTVIKGVQQGFIQNLDELPHYDKTIWEDHIRIGDLYLTLATRGCPYTCTFCFNNFFARLPEERRGKYVRQRSVDHVIEELKWAKERYNIKCVDFQDDVFTVNKAWIREFTLKYKAQIDIPFQCLIHPKYFDDDIAKWLSEAGCTWIQMGIQTMDEKFKHEHLRRYEHSDHIIRALESMKRYGIKSKTDHMLGLPGEPIESQATALRLYAEQTPERIQTFWTCFLPGTDMMKDGVAAGLVSPEQEQRLNEGVDFYFFRNEENIGNPALVKVYQNYELLYKIMPVLPGFIKKRIKTNHVSWMPRIVSRGVASIFDILIGFRYTNPEIVAYARHNVFHIYSFFRRKIGMTAPKATVPRKGAADKPEFYPQINMSVEEIAV